jgi:hypothetical protein
LYFPCWWAIFMEFTLDIKTERRKSITDVLIPSLTENFFIIDHVTKTQH